MLMRLLALDGFDCFLDNFLPITCFIIGWCNYFVNFKDSSRTEEIVNLSLAILYSFMFIVWLLTKILVLVI